MSKVLLFVSQGVVMGTFLATPNVVMFDPNVSDPLVLEYGMERFGATAQLETIRAVAMYAAMPPLASNESERRVSEPNNSLKTA